MNVLFVDPSLRSTGFYTSDGLWGTLNTKADHIEALGIIAKNFTSFAKLCDALVIEDYAFSKASRSVSINAEVGGIIRATFGMLGKPVIEVGISTWKSICGVRMKKDSASARKFYMETVHIKYGILFDSTDACDAYMIYRACKEILENKAKETDATERLHKRLVEAGIDKLL